VAFPNPTTGQPVNIYIDLGQPTAWVAVDIYTTAYRKILHLQRNEVPAGPLTISWNLKDKSGSPVSNGLYYAWVTTPSSHFLVKILILR
jgi:flagellar hook assembly protein FlgD